MRYFLKFFSGSPTYDGMGRPIPSERIHPGTEAIATDDPDVIKTLESFMKRGVGGVSETTLQGIEELKKKASDSPKPSDSFFGGPRVAMDTTSPSVPQERPGAAGVGDTMMPLTAEVAQLKADMAALKAKATEPPKTENVPPPTPPAVGKRATHKH